MIRNNAFRLIYYKEETKQTSKNVMNLNLLKVRALTSKHYLRVRSAAAVISTHFFFIYVLEYIRKYSI